MSFANKNSTYAKYWAEEKKKKLARAKQIRLEREMRRTRSELEECTFVPETRKAIGHRSGISQYNQSYMNNFHHRKQPFHSNCLQHQKENIETNDFSLNDTSLAQEFASFSSRRYCVSEADRNIALESLKRKMKIKVTQEKELTAQSPRESFHIPEFIAKQDLKQCNFCLRKFNEKALDRHSTVCKANKLKEKHKVVFDTKGKRLEEFYKNANDKSLLINQYQKQQVRRSKPRVKNWKRQSQQLRAAITDCNVRNVDEDYVKCPHCERTFNEQAATRHIPKCQFQQNRPKRLLKGSGNYASNKTKMK